MLNIVLFVVVLLIPEIEETNACDFSGNFILEQATLSVSTDNLTGSLSAGDVNVIANTLPGEVALTVSADGSTHLVTMTTESPIITAGSDNIQADTSKMGKNYK